MRLARTCRGGWGAAAALGLALFQGSATAQAPAALPPVDPAAPALPAQVPPPPAAPVPPAQQLPPLGTPPVVPELPPSQPQQPADALPALVNGHAPPTEPAPPVGTPPGQPAASGPGADGTPLNDYWRNGLRFESKDKAFSLFVGGRFQFDVVNYVATQQMQMNIPGTNPLDPGVSFRRIRFDMGGTLYKNMEYYAQVDFANGFIATPDASRLTNSTYPTDMWVQFKDLPFGGTIRVGNQKQPYSFEHLVSSRFLPFLERSLGFDAFVEHFNNGFEPGVTWFDTYANKRGTWNVGVFKSTRSPFGWNVGPGEVEVAGRVTGLPVYEDGGKYLLHLGVGANYRDPDANQERFRSRLDARNSPSAFSPLIADTGVLLSDAQELLVPELVAVCGPWSLQSEYYACWTQNVFTADALNRPVAPQGTVYMQSAYGEVGYFLTGEFREYNRETGVFTRVVPKRPFAWNKCGFTGWGAWQTVARYTYLDLNDKGVNGGRIHDMTLGLNWFMNPNMKAQFNYFLAHRNVADPDGDGFLQGFAVRLAIDF